MPGEEESGKRESEGKKRKKGYRGLEGEDSIAGGIGSGSENRRGGAVHERQ